MKTDNQILTKRDFLKKGLSAASGIVSITLLTGCSKKDDSGKEEEVAPAEDLMREHGVLNRILLIYDTCKEHLIKNSTFPMTALFDSATIIRKFIEDYHEKLEEDHLFPRFEKANKLTDLVATLRTQHNAGRRLTDLILKTSEYQSLSTEDNQKLIGLITQFTTMYRPHEAREDTVLFPALRNIISKNEYDSLGEDFEKKEHQLFGKDGFESMVDEVAGIEKQLGIFDLNKFTPAS